MMCGFTMLYMVMISYMNSYYEFMNSYMRSWPWNQILHFMTYEFRYEYEYRETKVPDAGVRVVLPWAARLWQQANLKLVTEYSGTQCQCHGARGPWPAPTPRLPVAARRPTAYQPGIGCQWLALIPGAISRVPKSEAPPGPAAGPEVPQDRTPCQVVS